jgi:hypothetical protein
LFAPEWLATLATPVSLLTAPLPSWYDGVAVIAGIVGSTAYVRRALAVTACQRALAEAAVLPAVRNNCRGRGNGGPDRAGPGHRSLARLFRAQRPRRRRPRRGEHGTARAGGAVRRGLVGNGGLIATAHVFEFDAAGPHVLWRRIRKERAGFVMARGFVVWPRTAPPPPAGRRTAAAGVHPPRSEPSGRRDPSQPSPEVWVVRPDPRPES